MLVAHFPASRVDLKIIVRYKITLKMRQYTQFQILLLPLVAYAGELLKCYIHLAQHFLSKTFVINESEAAWFV